MDRATIKMFIDQCNAHGFSGAADCIEDLAADVDRLQAELSASQAREEQLRDELFAVLVQDMSGDKARLKVEEFKSDTSALEALIARASEVMREKIAASVEMQRNDIPATGREFATAIRSTPGLKLEDLK